MTQTHSLKRVKPDGCVTLIGMAGSGKTTVGKALAAKLNWVQVDVDHVIEAAYGTRLQDVTDSMSKEEFLDVEADIVCKLNVQRTVLSPGGSAVYRQRAVDHLRSLGPIVFLDVPTPTIVYRISLNPERGLAIAPGQTIEDLIAERALMYDAAADSHLNADGLNPEQCAQAIVDWLGTTP